MSPETDGVTWWVHGGLSFLEMLTTEMSHSHSDGSFQWEEIRLHMVLACLSLKRGIPRMTADTFPCGRLLSQAFAHVTWEADSCTGSESVGLGWS